MSLFEIYNRAARGPREIILEIKTTGPVNLPGHRVVEIAAVEVKGGRATGLEFHTLIDPERDIPAEVAKQHGVTSERVKGKPKFSEIAAELRTFIGGAPVIMSSRTKDGFALDKGIINAELENVGVMPVLDGQWVNLRSWTEDMFGEKNAAFDKLLDRYNVSRKDREDKAHLALMEARLLSEVYPKVLKEYIVFSAKRVSPAVKNDKNDPSA